MGLAGPTNHRMPDPELVAPSVWSGIVSHVKPCRADLEHDMYGACSYRLGKKPGCVVSTTGTSHARLLTMLLGSSTTAFIQVLGSQVGESRSPRAPDPLWEEVWYHWCLATTTETNPNARLLPVVLLELQHGSCHPGAWLLLQKEQTSTEAKDQHQLCYLVFHYRKHGWGNAN